MYTPSKKLCEPFVLTEQKIRSIVEIIERRRPQDADERYNPVFSYKRLDKIERKTTDINDLFCEENCGDTRIVGLEIQSAYPYYLYSPNTNYLCYSIKFSSCEGEQSKYAIDLFKSIEYEVKGENKDLTGLLFNDLDQYIKNSVIWKKQKKILSLLKCFQSNAFFLYFLLLCLVVLIVTFLGGMSQNKTQQLIDKALLSQNISEKIDALLLIYQNDRRFFFKPSTLESIAIIVLFVILLSYTVISFSKKIQQKLNYLYPFVFSFGQSPESYESRGRLFKVILGIIGTLVLGVLGNLIYSLLT